MMYRFYNLQFRTSKLMFSNIDVFPECVTGLIWKNFGVTQVKIHVNSMDIRLYNKLWRPK